MALQAQSLPRVFVYDGTEFPCPGAHMTPEQVKQVYTASRPELTNAAIEGPEVKDGKVVYKFLRSVGAKG